MTAAVEVVCVGEILWDSLPAGLLLGGAPFNVAAHLSALGTRAGLVSRVGADRLGIEAVARATRLGVATDLIQTDLALPTGFVAVSIDDDGTPAFEILAPAAWDAIELTEEGLRKASQARAVVFGSLAQRADRSRRTIRRLCEGPALKVFDVNLRPPYEDLQIVRDSLTWADVVKLNEQELERLGGWYGLPRGTHQAAVALAELAGLRTVCITRGSAGAGLLRDGRWSEHPGFTVDVVDTVGAGDAFLAALLQGLLGREDDAEVLRRACLLGAFVAGRPGALPRHDGEALARIEEGAGGVMGRRGVGISGAMRTG